MAGYPSVRYHPTEARRTVADEKEDKALKSPWRDSPYSHKEREKLKCGPRLKPIAPKRNDYPSPDAFMAARNSYAEQVEEYEHSLIPE